MARKSKYDPIKSPLEVEDFARQGLSEGQIAKNLGISVATINVWKNTKPEFLDALRRGQRPVNLEVENAVLKRAKGYTFEHDIIDEEYSNSGNLVKRKVKHVSTHYPADINAAKFWLTNREKKKWRDKVVSEIEGNLSISFDKEDIKL